MQDVLGGWGWGRQMKSRQYKSN